MLPLRTSTFLPDWAGHSAYSDPGPYAPLLRELPSDVGRLGVAARNVIGHYRADLPDLPADRWDEIDSRWLRRILATDQARHPRSLLEPRPLTGRVAGCCRDQTLFVVAALRERGVPARSRVGFASYFSPDFHHDHVVAEYWNGSRWVRTDPALSGDAWGFDPGDLAVGPDAPFQTAAEVWRGFRDGTLDPATYGVSPGTELTGRDFIRTYVIFEVAHRLGDELLLWDNWGAAAEDVDPAQADRLADEVAELLVRSDAGDQQAEEELVARYRADERLHPGVRVTQLSPYGLPPVEVSLDADGSRGGGTSGAVGLTSAS